MQTVGLVNDHTIDCFRFRELASDRADPVRAKRRCEHRLPGHGRRPVRSRTRSGLLLAPRGRLGAPGACSLPRAARVLRAADPLRQTRHRPIGSRSWASRLRDPDGRRPCCHGRSGERVGLRSSATRRVGRCASLFAATYPHRVRALVLYGTYAKRSRSRRRLSLGADVGGARPGTPTSSRRRGARTSTSPTMCADADAAVSCLVPAPWPRLPQSRRRARPHPDELEGRRAGAAPDVQCPTLVLHRTGDRDARIEEGHYIAARIPGARFIELDGR